MRKVFLSFTLSCLLVTCLFGQKTAKEHFRFGYENYLKNDPEKALEHFNKSIELDSTVANVYFIRATTKMLLKDYDGALADYNIALEKGYTSKYLCYKYMAEACMLDDKKAEADKYLKEAEKHYQPPPEE